MNWRKTYTDINNVNNGQEFENSDYPTKEAFNVALNNTAYLKQNQDSQATLISNQGNAITNIEQRLNDLGFKRGYFDAFITYEEDDPDTGETYEVTTKLSNSDIRRNILNREGNRFMAKFDTYGNVLFNYAGTRFKKFKLVGHGTNGATDSDFYIYPGFVGQYVYANVEIEITHNYTDTLKINVAVPMVSGTGNERNTLTFSISGIESSFDGSNSYRLYSVNTLSINDGLSATQDII